MSYKAPTGGYYKVSAEVIHARPTGIFYDEENPNWRWWKFWLPKTIKREKVEIEKQHTGEQIVFLKEGQEIGSSFPIQKL